MDDIRIRNTVRTKNLEPDKFYSLDEFFAELDRLQDENDDLKREIADMHEDIEQNYRKKSPYELCGMSQRDFV